MKYTEKTIEQEIKKLKSGSDSKGLLSVLEAVMKDTAYDWSACAQECDKRKAKLRELYTNAQLECREQTKGEEEIEDNVKKDHETEVHEIRRKMVDLRNAEELIAKELYGDENLLGEKKLILEQLRDHYISEDKRIEELIKTEIVQKKISESENIENIRKSFIKEMNKAVYRESVMGNESLKDTFDQALLICDMDMKNAKKDVCESGHALLESKELVQYCQREWDCWNEMLQEKQFQERHELPARIPVGQIGIDLKKISQDDDFFTEMELYLDKYREMGMVDDGGRCYVPYSVARKENIGVYITADVSKYKEEIFALALQQYASYPVGKMELLSIDTENYRIFTPFMQLIREGDKRMIGQKEWSEEDEVEEALKTANDRIKGYQSYENQEKREQRENFRLILIAGFPHKFSKEALQALESIVSKGREYGTGIIIVDSMDHKEISTECREIVDKIRGKLTYIYDDANGKFGIRLEGDTGNTQPFRFGFRNTMDDMKQMIEELAKGIQEYARTPLNVMEINEDAFTDVWTESTIDGIEIPIGRSYDQVVSLVLGRAGTADKLDTRHHVLIEGATGSGKSKLLHTIVTSAIHQYDPSELEIYYLDFKYGMQSCIYSEYELPSFRAVAVNSEREFGLEVLEEVKKENERREKLIQEAHKEGINGYRRLPESERMPQILLIIDELSEFLSNKDEITEKSLEILESLLRTGRAQGVHLILVSQTINLSREMMENAVVRIAVSGSHNIIDCTEEELNQFFNNGMHAVFNEKYGTKADNVGIRNAYIGEEHRQLLSKLEKMAKQDHYAERYNLKTKILHTQISQNRNHPFEKMNFPDRKEVSLYLGEMFGFSEKLGIGFKRMDCQNLLLVAEKAEQILQTYYFTMISILHDELGKGIKGRNIWYVDLKDGADRSYIDSVIQHFPEKIRYISVDEYDEEEKIRSAKEFIRSIYEIVRDREKGDEEESPVYLFIYGAEYLDSLERKRIYRNQMNLFGNDTEKEMSLSDMLLYVLERGAGLGVHVIAATCDFELMEDNLCSHFEDFFSLRILYESIGGEKKREIAKRLIKDTSDKKRKDTIGAYYNMFSRNSNNNKAYQLFRRYDYPSSDWIKQYKHRYEKYQETEGR